MGDVACGEHVTGKQGDPAVLLLLKNLFLQSLYQDLNWV